MKGSVHSLHIKMRRPTYKSGNLDVKLPAKIRSRGLRGWKAWKRRWIVLHSLHDVTAGFAVVTLDVYNNSSSVQSQQLERSTIYLEAVIHIQRVISRSHPYAFYVEARETAVYLAADCETETQEWMDVLRDVFWPRPSLDIVDDDVHTVAVTDAAFCTLFGVHGGACHLCLGKDVVILRCMHTGHVLLEWPVSALARTYVDISVIAKDLGRLFIIEPRPHTSGWTTPLRLFNIRAQELVRRINDRMQMRKIRKLCSAVQLPTSTASVDEIVECRETSNCQSEKERPTSFYDQPRPAKTKYMTLTTVRRPQESTSYYDCPRFGFNLPESKLPSARQRSHSESHLILPALSISRRQLARSSSSFTCKYFASNVRAVSSPIQHSTLLPPSSEKDCSFNSRDSGFQLDEQGHVMSAGKLNQTVNGENILPQSQLQPQEYSELEASKKFSIVTEPLYEELDRYRKDVSKLLGMSVFHDKNNALPPPLPPRRPRTMSFANRNESQQKDVIRFLGMEDPWAKRMVETQRTATLGIRKKNLFHFLGVDRTQTNGNTAPLIDSIHLQERTPSSQRTDDNLLLNPEIALIETVDNVNEVANTAFYDVPNPSSAVVVRFSGYECFADKISEEIWQSAQTELSKFKNNHSTVCCRRSITNNTIKNRVLIYRWLHDKNRIVSLILPEQVFLSILYYSCITELEKYFLTHPTGNHSSRTSFHRRARQIQWM